MPPEIAPYEFSECDTFHPELNHAQESLPWGPWQWEDGRFTRSCEVPFSLNRISVGLPFIPDLLFFHGRLIVSQWAKKGSHRKVRDLERLIVKRLGYMPTAWVCFYCKKSGSSAKGPDGRTWHVDHIYPHVDGGDDQPDNKALACATCNLSKGPKSVVAFMEGRSV